MRLGLIYHQFVNSGGLEKYLVGLTRSFLESGHELEVVTARTDSTTQNLPSVRLHTLKRPALSSMLRLWDFAWRSESYCRHDRQLRSSVDLTIGFGRTVAHDIHRAGGGCHAVYSKLLPAAKRLGLKNRLELSLESQLYTSGKTRHFVVNASKVRDELQSTYGIDSGQCSVIHTAVDSTQFSPCASEAQRLELRDELGMPQNRQVALFVSSSHRRKGLGTLIHALASAQDLDLVDVWVAGKQLDAAHKQIAEAVPGMMQRIKFLGDRTDLPALYRACDYFVHPTLYDACANTVLQAMASGTPAIVSAADGAAEFITHHENGFLLRDPTDSIELRSHLKVASTHNFDQRSKLGLAARERVLPLTWPAHVSKWENLFSRMKAGNGDHQPL